MKKQEIEGFIKAYNGSPNFYRQLGAEIENAEKYTDYAVRDVIAGALDASHPDNRDEFIDTIIQELQFYRSFYVIKADNLNQQIAVENFMSSMEKNPMQMELI